MFSSYHNYDRYSSGEEQEEQEEQEGTDEDVGENVEEENIQENQNLTDIYCFGTKLASKEILYKMSEDELKNTMFQLVTEPEYITDSGNKMKLALETKKIDINSKNWENKTFLDIASSKFTTSHTSMTRLLTMYGAQRSTSQRFRQQKIMDSLYRKHLNVGRYNNIKQIHTLEELHGEEKEQWKADMDKKLAKNEDFDLDDPKGKKEITNEDFKLQELRRERMKYYS